VHEPSASNNDRKKGRIDHLVFTMSCHAALLPGLSSLNFSPALRF
jgi:hypothetical protein